MCPVDTGSDTVSLGRRVPDMLIVFGSVGIGVLTEFFPIVQLDKSTSVDRAMKRCDDFIEKMIRKIFYFIFGPVVAGMGVIVVVTEFVTGAAGCGGVTVVPLDMGFVGLITAGPVSGAVSGLGVFGC